VKLLLDENVSRRLIPFLQEQFPGSFEVALLGLERASDLVIDKMDRTLGRRAVTKKAGR
jgi:predicted nuclease of predicted toxin-antitoxin system